MISNLEIARRKRIQEQYKATFFCVRRKHDGWYLTGTARNPGTFQEGFENVRIFYKRGHAVSSLRRFIKRANRFYDYENGISEADFEIVSLKAQEWEPLDDIGWA